MVESDDIILLDEKVPIRSIKKPFCKKCMNKVNRENDLCEYCQVVPHPNESNWFFNRNISLGVYHTYDCENYNNIPLNIISRMILILKGSVKKPKKDIGALLSNGMFKIINKFPFLLDVKTYLVIPPKYDRSEENQCIYFLKPLLKLLQENGYRCEDISNKLKKVKDTGKSRGKGRLQRFLDIKGAHKFEEMDLMGKKVLIFDDVFTTSSTIWDISRELKAKNAGEINVLTLGRALIGNGNFMKDDIPIDLSFEELIIYFSSLDVILYPKKIENVNLEDVCIQNLYLKCNCKGYLISIDFKNRVLKHNCTDYIQKRYKNKIFCKHITKFFLEIREKQGEEFARKKLYSIYKYLIHWDFVSNF
ncbi:MAG: ComF family protein [Candidatus Thorarchaeota archaeon]